MRDQKFKFAAAVIVTAAVITGYSIFNNGSSTVYAMEQTIEANHTVRNLHIRVLNSGSEDNPNNPSDVWLKFDDKGQLQNARAVIPESPDGPKVVNWQAGKLQVWLQRKKMVVAIKDPGMAAQISAMISYFDPKLTFERMYKAKGKGEVEPEIVMPQNEGDPIIIKISDEDLKERYVLYVDAETKLLVRMDRFVQKSGAYVAAESFEFLEYNQQIDSKMFELGDVPEGTTFVDHVNNPIGLIQGNLDDNAIAMKVAEAFFEGLIAGDFEKVGLVYSGLGAKRTKEIFGDMKVVKLVSIDEPVDFPNPKVGGLQVACHVVIDKDGQEKEVVFKLAVRRVEGQPYRWNIHGMSGNK